jgi:hypothetical protein
MLEITRPRRTRFADGRRRTIASVGTLLLVAGALTASAAFGAHGDVSLPGSNFEIDSNANLKVDHAAPSIDWMSVSEQFKNDTASGRNDESFGQGTKEDTAEPTVVKGSIPPNKSDLKRFGVYQEGTGASGFLNLYWTRVQDPTGTTNMDFEFNKRQCTPGTADIDCTPNDITPKRSVGDLLITYDLSQGGTKPSLSLREWTGSVWGSEENLTASNKATGSINTTAIPATESDIGALDARTFGEAQLDLSAIFDSATCESFGSAYLKSRSSDSFPAALKDFVPPAAVNISNCGAVQVNKTNDLGAALAGAGFTLYKDAAPMGGSRGSEDTVAAGTCTTPATGTCTISDVLYGQYWLVETTVPANHTSVDPQHVSVTGTTAVVFNLVNPRIVLQPTISTAQRFVPNDSATIGVAAGQGTLQGGVVFKLYLNNDCSGNAVYTSSSQPVSGALNQTVSSDNTTAYTTSTDMSWMVTYTSTNTGHHNVISNCTEHSSITIDNG